MLKGDKNSNKKRNIRVKRQKYKRDTNTEQSSRTVRNK